MAITDAEYENQRFVVLRRFRDMPDAFLFGSILDSAEIECYLADENTIRMDWFWSNFLGGIKLCVRKADADEASSLLEQGVPEKFDVEGVGEYQQPRCPKCQSLDVILPRIEQSSGLHRCSPRWALAPSSKSLGMRCLRPPMARVQRETTEQLPDVSIFHHPACTGPWLVDVGDRNSP